MAYLGDFTLGDTIDFRFTTVNIATGVATSLLGTPALAAYVGNGTTEITAGITLTVDFDGRTGLNHVRVVASGANGFAAQTNVDIVVTAGTVGGASAVSYVVGSFSIENRSTQAIKSDTAAILVDTAEIGAAGAGLTALASAANLATVDTVVDAILVDTAEIGVAGAGLTALATQASVNTIDDFLDTEIAAIKAKTDLIPAAPAAVGDIPTAVENADALLGRNVSGGSSSGRTVKQAFHFIRNRWVVSSGTLTVYDTDDSTSSWTASVTGTAGADPVTASDPA